jgi:hypothetical protein
VSVALVNEVNSNKIRNSHNFLKTYTNVNSIWTEQTKVAQNHKRSLNLQMSRVRKKAQINYSAPNMDCHLWKKKNDLEMEQIAQRVNQVP